MDYKPRLKAQLEIVRGTTETILSSFKTPQDWTYQVQPQANHALWVAGHLSVADNMIVSGLVSPRQMPRPLLPAAIAKCSSPAASRRV